MRIFIYLFFVVFFSSCNSPDSSDCWQTTGKIISKTFEISDFNKIKTRDNIELKIKQSDSYFLEVETGENLMNDIEVFVENEELQIRDNNHCNIVRKYNPVKVYLEVPDIVEIRNSSQYSVISEGILNFENLVLYSEDHLDPESSNVGSFDLNINSESIEIISNGIGDFLLRGKTNSLKAIFANFNISGKLIANELQAKKVELNQRGNNDMWVFPIESISGNIYGAGDIILFNTPPSINVNEHFKGKLIFKD